MNEVFLSLTSHSSSLRPSTLKVHKCVFSEKWGQSLKVARYEMSAIKTGIAARIEKKVTMEMMLNFLAFFANIADCSLLCVSLAFTEYFRATTPMQDKPQMMLQMASLL